MTKRVARLAPALVLALCQFSLFAHAVNLRIHRRGQADRRRLIPDGRPPMPAAPSAPTGPTVKIADSDKNRLRTFPSLMSTMYEKELVKWHATGQAALIDVQKGLGRKIGQGIAGDGAYNRTLTPLGFQRERRDLWEAPHVYLAMSPFLYANNMTGALLMYHGYADQNVGTDPDNSIRLYHALNGLGKTTALYMYPLEDHGPASRETLLDLWARWAPWLDKYVKNPHPLDPAKKITTECATR